MATVTKYLDNMGITRSPAIFGMQEVSVINIPSNFHTCSQPWHSLYNWNLAEGFYLWQWTPTTKLYHLQKWLQGKRWGCFTCSKELHISSNLIHSPDDFEMLSMCTFGPFIYKKLQTYFSIVHCIQSPWEASVWQNFTFLVTATYSISIWVFT